MTLSVITINAFGMYYIKQIYIYDAITSHFENKDLKNDLKLFQKENSWLFGDNLEDIKNNLEMKIDINNDLDVCIRIK